jgi:hypothetical protein
MDRRSLLKGLLVLPVTPIAKDMLDIDYSWAEERALGWEIDQGGGTDAGGGRPRRWLTDGKYHRMHHPDQQHPGDDLPIQKRGTRRPL